MIGEILQREEAADLIRKRDDLFGDFALVVGIAAAFRDELIRFRQVRVLEEFARVRRAQFSTICLTARTPMRCPAGRGSARAAAQRPLPSMMTAM